MHKAAGMCRIPSELLKSGGKPMAYVCVLAVIKQSVTIPMYLLKVVVIPLYGQRGSLSLLLNQYITLHTKLSSFIVIVESHHKFICSL